MKRNSMRKNLLQSIRRSLGRYIAIVAIIALGCALFMGLKITKIDMVLTGQHYTDKQNMFDLQLINTYGWTQEQVEKIAGLDGVVDAEGSIYRDAFAGGSDGKQNVYRFYGMPERINKVYLLSGHLPNSPGECVVDGAYFPESAIGQKITLSQSNDSETLDTFREDTFTIVGRISSPLYMDMTRGSTDLGSGTIAAYVYLHRDAFLTEYYTDICITLPGDWTVYSEEFTDLMEEKAEHFEPLLLPLAQQRYEKLKADAEKEYADGLAEYEDGLKQYEEGKLEAEQKLSDALKELEDAQAAYDEGMAAILDGEKQLEEGQQQITEGLTTLENSRLELEKAKADAYTQMAEAYAELMENYKLVTSSLAQVNDGLSQIDSGIAQIDDGISQIDSSLPLLEMMLNLTQTQVAMTQAAYDAAVATGNEALIPVLEARLAEQTATLLEYQTQLDTVKKTRLELETTRAGLITQRAELIGNQKMLQDSLLAIEQGFLELETNESVANNQFAAAQAQLNAGQMELEAGQAELNEKRAELEAGRQELLEGKIQLEEGWAEYEAGKLEAEAELADAKAQLEDAAVQLEEGRQAIEDLRDPEVFVLSRNTNAGYLALDSNSNIVKGIANVLPVFFLLIAALVCITTMTRMVEEERTQIGTLKALGYSSGAIMSKYLWYSASAAILGCGLGVAVGCTFFPNLLWDAYSIIFNIRPDLSLTVDWTLSIGISAAYIGISSLVTWYCCRRTLQEVPASLIRPRAPESGKQILLEKLPFWKHLSFLNKVMLRNVFRYRQRFLMMIIGIGGCTALLLTGFGLRDTVVDVANIQFEEVTRFDLEVYFGEGKTAQEQEKILQDWKEAGITNQAAFFNQTSVELDFDGLSRDVYMLTADDSIRDYLDFHRNGNQLPMPGPGEALISVGVAEILNIREGDTITVRDSDMQMLTLTVGGIYENHVYNYVIVTPETVADQWGEAPAAQKAFLFVHDGVDIRQAASEVREMEDVINVTVCEETSNMVNSMMDALDMVVVVIVFSAGLLGAIVLYNLTNININERIREIATIKVLGFNAAETSAYVFKENIMLTVMGVIAGLPLGVWFLDFVMMNIKIDMVWFKTRLNWPSYIYAVLLTLLCAAVVDFIFHHKLQKINMAEALKSVE